MIFKGSQEEQLFYGSPMNALQMKRFSILHEPIKVDGVGVSALEPTSLQRLRTSVSMYFGQENKGLVARILSDSLQNPGGINERGMELRQSQSVLV
eukprot:1891484-Amphidinium_carterae.1